MQQTEMLDLMSAVSHELEHIRKLATADREKRFGKLYRLVRKMDMLESAWAHVKNNKGSRTAGVDGMTRDDFNAEELSKLLKLCTFHAAKRS
jgi:retron-type reverse transcriptase